MVHFEAVVYLLQNEKRSKKTIFYDFDFFFFFCVCVRGGGGGASYYMYNCFSHLLVGASLLR